MIYKLAGQVFDIKAEHRIADVNYPKGWFLDSSNRVAIGLVEEVEVVVVVAPPTYQELLDECLLQRGLAYRAEADGLFFQEQRGEVPVGTWLTKITEIKARFPKPI